MRRTIEKWPSRLLSQPSQLVTDFSDGALQSLINDMLEMVQTDEHAAGLAAVQVGVPLQVFVVSAKVTGDQDAVFINPSLELDQAMPQLVEAEGCLSLPSQQVKVKRSRAVTIHAYDRDGQPFTVVADEFYARCIQHEYDHLQGITLFNKASFAQKERIKRTFRPR